MQLDCEGARVEIDLAVGGRIASLELEGLDLLVGRHERPRRWGCYPMAPYAGRVRSGRFAHAGRDYQLPLTHPPHAIHGTTFDRVWTQDGDGQLSIDLGPDWPFEGRALQRIELVPGELRLQLEVHSAGAPFPASLGWHPWFRRQLARGGEAELRFDAASMYQRDAAGMPNGELVSPPEGPWDDCFTEVRVAPTITWPGALVLSLESDVAHWVVFSEPEHALCVEPQTGPPDALNIAPRLVAPGDPLMASFVLRWRADP